jgi:Ca2+/H+ antiporter, TMEM165/GDT1 family
MKFRTKHSPLILLLLPPLIAALANTPTDTQAVRRVTISPRDARDALEPEPEPAVAVNSGARRDIPTKDAPVDGKDGKPHLGPFVETDISTGGDLSDLTLKGKPSDWKTVDGKEIPESNDCVMFDKNRERPQEGTTGLEGGVTEKERTRKAQEGKAGGKLQTQPEPPKEQPPLPHSEEQKIKSSTKDSTKLLAEEDGDVSYTGLDVSIRSIRSSSACIFASKIGCITNGRARNQRTYPRNHGQTARPSLILPTKIIWTCPRPNPARRS